MSEKRKRKTYVVWKKLDASVVCAILTSSCVLVCVWMLLLWMSGCFYIYYIKKGSQRKSVPTSITELGPKNGSPERLQHSTVHALEKRPKRKKSPSCQPTPHTQKRDLCFTTKHEEVVKKSKGKFTPSTKTINSFLYAQKTKRLQLVFYPRTKHFFFARPFLVFHLKAAPCFRESRHKTVPFLLLLGAHTNPT